MNKSILVRGSIIMGIFLVIIGAAVGCSMLQKDDVVPQISNKGDVYLSLSEFDITNQELWEMMRNVDGINYLIDYIDEIILADYIIAITQDEVDAKVQLLTYKTDDAEIIADIKSNTDIDKIYVDAFRNGLIVLGYNPDDADDLKDYVKLEVALENMLRDNIKNAEEGSSYEIDSTYMENHYEATFYNDACALEVRFSSSTEANLVMDHFNLVPDYNTGFGLYTGTDPIEEVSAADFDETNTTQLTDEEVFTQYVKLYNYMNPWMPQIPEAITQEDYCNDFSDIATYNFDDMTKNSGPGEPIFDLAGYIFITLDLVDEETINYGYNVKSFGSSSILAYKISQEERTPFDDLTDPELLDIFNELVEEQVNSTNTDILIREEREEVGLEIFDPFMKLKYEYTDYVSYDNEGHDTLVAKFGDTDITADDLFTYMEEKIGTFYSIELVKVKRLVLSDEFEDLYGTERDYMNNSSDEMKLHREELSTMKMSFGNNIYAEYGFSSTAYTWEEFLFLAFGSTSENDVLEQLFVMGSIQPNLIYPTIDYDSVAPYIQEQIDNYFSLNASHIYISVDFDLDFTPDSFDDLLAGLDTAELAEYNLLKVAFEDLIIKKYKDDEYTLDEIIEEFQDSLIDDVDNEWATFKQFGFIITYEDLTPGTESLNYLNSVPFDENFSGTLKRIYDLYIRPENEELNEYVDNQLTVTDFGLHLIIAQPGVNFLQPSAFFEVDSENPDAYSDGSANENVVPTEAQIALFNEIKFQSMKEELADVVLPNSVYSAIESYYLDVFNAYFSYTGYALTAAEYMLDNNPVYAANNVDSIALLEQILDTFYKTNFPAEFIIPTN